MTAPRAGRVAFVTAALLAFGLLVAATVLALRVDELVPTTAQPPGAAAPRRAPALHRDTGVVDAPPSAAPQARPEPAAAPAQTVDVSTGDVGRLAWTDAPRPERPATPAPPDEGFEVGSSSIRVPAVSAHAAIRRSSARSAADPDAALPSARLIICVRASETDEPLARCAVALTSGGVPQRGIETDGAGRAETLLAGEGRVTVRITSADRVRVERRDVAFAPGDAIQIDAALPLGTTAAGRVITTDDEPLRGAEVAFYAEDAWWDALAAGVDAVSLAETVTDENGDVAASGLPRAARLVWTVRAEGYASSSGAVETTVATDVAARVYARLPRGQGLVVNVAEADGSAAAHAIVYAVPASEIATHAARLRVLLPPDQRLTLVAAARVHEARSAGDTDVALRRARSDASGAAVFSDLPPAPAYVVYAERAPVDCSPAVEHRVVDGPARLRFAPLVSVRARVQMNGVALPSCDVRLVAYPMSASRRTDAAGLTRAATVPAAPLYLHVLRQGVVDAHFIGSPYPDRATEFRVELRTRPSISGVVQDERGKCIAGAALTCGAQATRSDASGRFEFGGIAHSSAYVTAYAPGHAPAGASFERASREAPPLVLRRTGAARIHVAELPAVIVPAWHRVVVQVGGEVRVLEGLGPPPEPLLVDELPTGRALIGLALPHAACAWSVCDVVAGVTSDADVLHVRPAQLVRVRVDPPRNVDVTRAVLLVHPVSGVARQLADASFVVTPGRECTLELPWSADEQLRFFADAEGCRSLSIVRNTEGAQPIVIELLPLPR